MRVRSIAALSVAVASALLLAGCTGPDGTDEAGAGGMCDAAAPSGAASEGVEVGGAAGAAPTVTFDTPLEVTEVERTVVTEGEGAAVGAGDYVQYALAAFDAASGEQLGVMGYDAPIQPQQTSPESALGAFFGCATVGSRVVVTLPANESGGEAPAVYVLDLLDATPADEWCMPEPFGPERPAVEFDEQGAPTVTVPAVESPAHTNLEVLVAGDGDVVEPGDEVEVHYEGVRWSDGTVFDSSWERGTSLSFATDGVVAGFGRALEGQKVGSTVLVAMPAMCGYGVTGTSQHELDGEALVFVVQILGVGSASEQ